MNNGLTVCIEDGAITVRLPLDTLAVAFRASDVAHDMWAESDMVTAPLVTDPAAFAKAVVAALCEEVDETGLTLPMKMFDAAFEAAIESGAEGVDLNAPFSACEERGR